MLFSSPHFVVEIHFEFQIEWTIQKSIRTEIESRHTSHGAHWWRSENHWPLTSSASNVFSRWKSHSDQATSFEGIVVIERFVHTEASFAFVYIRPEISQKRWNKECKQSAIHMRAAHFTCPLMLMGNCVCVPIATFRSSQPRSAFPCRRQVLYELPIVRNEKATQKQGATNRNNNHNKLKNLE